MKKAIISYILLAGLVFGCMTGNTGGEESKIRIPATTGLMNGNDGDIFKLNRITNAERKELGIDAIAKDDINKSSNRVLGKGKEIYKGEKGRLATFLVIWEEQAIFEYLAGYDASGNVTDCIRIGFSYYYDSDYGSGIIEGNKVKCTNSWGDPGESSSEGISEIYTITDDLRFVPFAFPPKSYPAEVPFIAFETFTYTPDGIEESSFYHSFESIMCTGVSGNQYTFKVNGKSRQGTKHLKAAERTYMLVPMDSERNESIEAAIKVVIPATGEGKIFEVKAKGLHRNNFDGKTFNLFRIRK